MVPLGQTQEGLEELLNRLQETQQAQGVKADSPVGTNPHHESNLDHLQLLTSSKKPTLPQIEGAKVAGAGLKVATDHHRYRNETDSCQTPLGRAMNHQHLEGPTSHSMISQMLHRLLQEIRGVLHDLQRETSETPQDSLRLIL